LDIGFSPNPCPRKPEAPHTSLGDYLRAVPRNDAERQDAFDLALKGAVVCLLGLLFPPLLLIGIIPLFYGARKMGYVSMGLGLVDDAEHSIE
ncbi:MAG: hypothetical protein QF681_19355, partial [Vicinamibacterales bacterium]|jgi:hypothetical protein|nr:hypothetical protein [Vicinamibacterales bacterium]